MKNKFILPNSPPPTSSKKITIENGYITFCNFYKETFQEEYENCRSQREWIAKAAKFWKSLPNHIKNSFIKYANDERLIRIGTMTQPLTESDDLIIIFDDRSSLTDPYEQIFDRYVHYN
ncbi:17463_t:CDS:1 [Funneliformis caledonium]|uniref:17463_t:CDS:1 n=1 Tax=Funneliformis caledonium TaxID=1117310 RepID=A0A9N9H125_9GLOM|nr:17463_t:CDS:1 [Funneliformis caledonium]